MPSQETTFTCVIVDSRAKERFFASVRFVKKQPVKASQIDKGRIELADIYIWAVADRLVTGLASTVDPKKITPLTFEDVHGHFVLYQFTGEGKYIRRNRYDRDMEKRVCSTWDLGHEFGAKVAELLGGLM